MRYFILSVLAAFGLGYQTADLIDSLKVEMNPKYKVDDCLSNGLYFEKITGIRYGKVLKKAKYETVGIHRYNGKFYESTAPDTVDSWIADESWTLVDPKLCEIK